MEKFGLYQLLISQGESFQIVQPIEPRLLAEHCSFFISISLLSSQPMQVLSLL